MYKVARFRRPSLLLSAVIAAAVAAVLVFAPVGTAQTLIYTVPLEPQRAVWRLQHYPPGSTKDQGVLEAHFEDFPYVIPSASYVQWNQTAINWIMSNAHGSFSSNEFQVAIVFHAFLAKSNGACANADGWIHGYKKCLLLQWTTERSSAVH
jgi:hypothetical protein